MSCIDRSAPSGRDFVFWFVTHMVAQGRRDIQLIVVREDDYVAWRVQHEIKDSGYDCGGDAGAG